MRDLDWSDPDTDLVCPYCNHKYSSIAVDPDESDEEFEEVCDKCGGFFEYSFLVTYKVREAEKPQPNFILDKYEDD